MDDTALPDADEGAETEGAVGGMDIVEEMSMDADVVSEEMSNEPSTSGNIFRKRKSDTSHPVEKRLSLGSGSFEPKDRVSDMEPDMESFSIPIPKEQSIEEIMKSALANEGSYHDTALNALMGDIPSDCMGVLFSEAKTLEKRREVLARIFELDRRPLPVTDSLPPAVADSMPSVITDAHIERCKQFGIYKCKCGRWFSSEINFEEHKRSCDSNAPDKTD